MSTIKVVIADDEKLCRDVICQYLRCHSAATLVAECSNGIEVVDAVREHQPDLLFLDIQMPDLDGFGALNELAGINMPMIIFTTAYDKYALRAFDASAIDYLLKPFDQQRFDAAIEKAQRYFSAKENVKLFVERLLVKENRKLFPVYVNDVEVFEADNDYVRLHITGSGRKHLINNSLTNLQNVLNPAGFVRIHKSAIIKINAIAEMKPHTNGEFKILMKCGKEVRLSRTYKDALKTIGGFISQ